MSDNLPALAPGEYKVFSARQEDIEDLLSELQGISVQDLDRVKIPAGGALFFEVPTATGPEPVKELRGIIVAKKEQRVMWRTGLNDREGGAKPPDCASRDGFTGYGKRWDSDDESQPHECSRCPLSQFGGNCKPVLLVFLLRPQTLLPLVLVLPRMSIKSTKQYLLRLSGQGIRGMAVETQFTLKAEKSTDGIVYAQAVPSWVRNLNKSEVESLGRLAAGMKRLFASVNVRAQDVDGNPYGREQADREPSPSAGPPPRMREPGED